MPQRVVFVTGRLAEPSLRRVVGALAQQRVVEPHVVVLNIQVAALMTSEWVERKLELPAGVAVDRVVLPGYCRGDLAAVAAKLGVPVEIGPRDLHDIPEMFGQKPRLRTPPERYTIEIVAEINHAARLPMEAIVAQAEAYRRDGADVIDIGCDPQADRAPWRGVAEVVRELRSRGFRVSVDSFQLEEVALATAAGAELVLSVNTGNAEAAKDWGAEVVAIPDDPRDLASLDRTIEKLERDGVRYRIDPVIEPIGFGFSESLGRYLEVRRRYPGAAMMMGVGNLTELTDADSAGVNALLIGFCQEQNVGSVLTTQVINWARSSVREIDLARRVMHHAVTNGTPPKHVDERLVLLRDPKLRGYSAEELDAMAKSLTDRSVRIFVEHGGGTGGESGGGTIHVMNSDFHASGDDPMLLFDRIEQAFAPHGGLDASHAFYLGHELSKALTALTLGKQYTQDEALRWGFLTREEVSHHDRRVERQKARRRGAGGPGAAGGDARPEGGA